MYVMAQDAKLDFWFDRRNVLSLTGLLKVSQKHYYFMWIKKAFYYITQQGVPEGNIESAFLMYQSSWRLFSNFFPVIILPFVCTFFKI